MSPHREPAELKELNDVIIVRQQISGRDSESLHCFNGRFAANAMYGSTGTTGIAEAGRAQAAVFGAI